MELKGSTSQKVQWVFIFIAHMLLLYWIYYALSQGGNLSVVAMVAHFAGIGTYGALLITFSAYLGRRNYRKELEAENKSHE